MNSRTERYAGRVVLLLFTVGVALPFVSILLASLQKSGAPVSGFQLPSDPQWGNFTRAWSAAAFGTLFQNSAVIALGVVPIAVLFASLAGYAFGTMRFRGRGFLFSFLLIGLTLPYEAALVPLYYDLRSLHLTNSYWALILPLIGLFMPFGTFWMRAHFLSTPVALIEAAQLDGASRLTIFWKVLLPNARPAVTTLGLLYFMWSWNQFLLALILIQDPARRTAPAGLGTFVGQYSTDVPMLSAATLIVMAPVVLVYLLCQRQFIRGMLEGALKG